jgi:hypothetical protein
MRRNAAARRSHKRVTRCAAGNVVFENIGFEVDFALRLVARASSAGKYRDRSPAT